MGDGGIPSTILKFTPSTKCKILGGEVPLPPSVKKPILSDNNWPIEKMKILKILPAEIYSITFNGVI